MYIYILSEIESIRYRVLLYYNIQIMLIKTYVWSICVCIICNGARSCIYEHLRMTHVLDLVILRYKGTRYATSEVLFWQVGLE